MKSIIQEAGVGAQYGAHSIRSAASTAAYMKGMSISDVLSIADWTSDNVFITDPLSRGLDPFSIQSPRYNYIILGVVIVTLNSLCLIAHKIMALNNTMSYSQPKAPNYNL